jgi:hypothetical protein
MHARGAARGAKVLAPDAINAVRMGFPIPPIRNRQDESLIQRSNLYDMNQEGASSKEADTLIPVFEEPVKCPIERFRGDIRIYHHTEDTEGFGFTGGCSEGPKSRSGARKRRLEDEAGPQAGRKQWIEDVKKEGEEDVWETSARREGDIDSVEHSTARAEEAVHFAPHLSELGRRHMLQRRHAVDAIKVFRRQLERSVLANPAENVSHLRMEANIVLRLSVPRPELVRLRSAEVIDGPELTALFFGKVHGKP